MGYLHIDCHLDAAVDWGGNEITNASGPPMALKLPNCNGENMAHMGSRNGLNPKDWLDFWIDNRIPVLTMAEVVERRGRCLHAGDIRPRRRRDRDNLLLLGHRLHGP